MLASLLTCYCTIHSLNSYEGWGIGVFVAARREGESINQNIFVLS